LHGLLHFALVDGQVIQVTILPGTSGERKRRHLAAQFSYLALWARGAFPGIDCTRKEIKNRMAIITIKFINGHIGTSACQRSCHPYYYAYFTASLRQLNSVAMAVVPTKAKRNKAE
jgi:hypothetical protein